LLFFLLFGDVIIVVTCEIAAGGRDAECVKWSFSWKKINTINMDLMGSLGEWECGQFNNLVN
jgi:hypothetical protein